MPTQFELKSCDNLPMQGHVLSPCVLLIRSDPGASIHTTQCDTSNRKRLILIKRDLPRLPAVCSSVVLLSFSLREIHLLLHMLNTLLQLNSSENSPSLLLFTIYRQMWVFAVIRLYCTCITFKGES